MYPEVVYFVIELLYLYANILQFAYIYSKIQLEVINVSNTATVYARIEPKLKEDVDSILKELGVTPSSLIQMLYSQIKLTKRIPFDISIPKKSIFIEDLTKEELNYELLKGVSDIENNNVKSSDEVDKILKDKFNI